MSPVHIPKRFQLPSQLMLLILAAAADMARHSRQAFRIPRSKRRGITLRPGRDTPLWNALARAVRPYLVRYGDQANLGRLLGLPRQRVHAYFAGCTQMPDAERTLELLAWLAMVRQGRRPA